MDQPASDEERDSVGVGKLEIMRSPLLAPGICHPERLAAVGEERPLGVGQLSCEEVVVGYVDGRGEELGEVGD